MGFSYVKHGMRMGVSTLIRIRLVGVGRGIVERGR
jgi:hypothetical protein